MILFAAWFAHESVIVGAPVNIRYVKWSGYAEQN